SGGALYLGIAIAHCISSGFLHLAKRSFGETGNSILVHARVPLNSSLEFQHAMRRGVPRRDVGVPPVPARCATIAGASPAPSTMTLAKTRSSVASERQPRQWRAVADRPPVGVHERKPPATLEAPDRQLRMIAEPQVRASASASRPHRSAA